MVEKTVQQTQTAIMGQIKHNFKTFHVLWVNMALNYRFVGGSSRYKGGRGIPELGFYHADGPC